MTSRLKTVSKIARIIDLQKEILEFQIQKIAQRIRFEQDRLAGLKKDFQNTIDRFGERADRQQIQSSKELGLLFGAASQQVKQIEEKKGGIAKTKKELAIQQALWDKAHKKKKAVEVLENKLAFQEKREEGVLEQKNMDYLSLSRRARP
jgi:predicted HicB family RNase H-like nuclease